jgi:hypothetical protein|tara:strand:+ start:52 stop:306 length:255 start_codon:yes stop_codon:yes gene_type:complete
MSEDSKATVTFKDTEYNVEDLNNRAQQLVGLVQAVRGEAQGLQDRLNILQAAELKFSEELEGELTSMNSITEEEEQEEFSGFGS